MKEMRNCERAITEAQTVKITSNKASQGKLKLIDITMAHPPMIADIKFFFLNCNFSEIVCSNIKIMQYLFKICALLFPCFGGFRSTSPKEETT